MTFQGDLRKNSDSLTSNEKDRFREIQQDGMLTMEQAEAFWDQTFQPEQESNIECDNRIFGWKESDINLDFEASDDLRRIANKFDDRTLSTPERMKLSAEFAERLAKELGLKNLPSLSFHKMDESTLGEYRHGDDKIVLNSEILQYPHLLRETIAHEMRHAYQWQRAENPSNVRDFLYSLNFANYVSPVVLPDGSWALGTDYEGQLVEADARAFEKIFD